MDVAEHDEDQAPNTLVRLRTRDSLIAQLDIMAHRLESLDRELDDSDWPPPPSEPARPFEVAPSTPLSDRH